jgi:hypothetical protein
LAGGVGGVGGGWIGEVIKKEDVRGAGIAHQAITSMHNSPSRLGYRDDALKNQRKDSIDARISAWKNGSLKETNIRALLAILDMILWDLG